MNIGYKAELQNDIYDANTYDDNVSINLHFNFSVGFTWYILG